MSTSENIMHLSGALKSLVEASVVAGPALLPFITDKILKINNELDEQIELQRAQEYNTANYLMN